MFPNQLSTTITLTNNLMILLMAIDKSGVRYVFSLKMQFLFNSHSVNPFSISKIKMRDVNSDQPVGGSHINILKF